MRQASLIVVMVLTMALAILLSIAIWPYLHYLGIAATGFGVVLFACLSLLALASTWHFVGILRARKRREWLSARVIIAGDIVIMPDGNGGYAHLSAEHEAAKLLSAPVTVTGERILSAEDQEIIQRSKVLTAHFEQGKGMHAIEKELGIPYNKVRDWCNTADALRAKQQSW